MKGGKYFTSRIKAFSSRLKKDNSNKKLSYNIIDEDLIMLAWLYVQNKPCRFDISLFDDLGEKGIKKRLDDFYHFSLCF